jgi:anaerobic magnesium-protoporphyrin IX monomethyl ester cyclase
MRIALVHAPLDSTVSDRALGYQTPLGLLMLAGPLLDHGHQVDLLDAARDRSTDTRIVQQLNDSRPDVVMVGHSASTKAHTRGLRLLRAVKTSLPAVVTVYGGVHPTYHCQETLAENPAVDVIVRGEGEATVLELVTILSLAREMSGCGSPFSKQEGDLSWVAGIAWRCSGQVILNPPRAPLEDLDSHRIAWELISDWDKYQAFGVGRTAVVQFSRGCPHRCTYCGQWSFWQRWRHRDVARFVDELEFLHRKHGIQFFWFADENATTDKAVWQALLEEIACRNMRTGMTASLRAQDVVRDSDILDLYRRAGFLYVLMGVETVNDETLKKIHKGSTVDEAYQAVKLLRKQGILSIIDYVFGLEEETLQTIWRALCGLNHCDSDFVNALYLTPYAWTSTGRQMLSRAIIEADLRKWDCRHQVVALNGITPTQLFFGAKLVELLYHLHPRRLWRSVTIPDQRLRRHFRFAYRHVVGVFWEEVCEFLRSRSRSAASPEADGRYGPAGFHCSSLSPTIADMVSSVPHSMGRDSSCGAGERGAAESAVARR